MTLRTERWVCCDSCSARIPAQGETALERAGWKSKLERSKPGESPWWQRMRHTCPVCQMQGQLSLGEVG